MKSVSLIAVVLCLQLSAEAQELRGTRWEDKKSGYRISIPKGWEQVPTTATPPPRFGHAMAYDAESERIVLFGGSGGTPEIDADMLADTWVFDTASGSWTEMTGRERIVRATLSSLSVSQIREGATR